MAVQNEFFTWQSLGTFGGASIATTAVTNAICSFFPGLKNPSVIGLPLALFLCLLGAVN
jgi:hypothetical protein